MPIYNGKKYLKETLESILQQTYKDFELICINDASTDETLDILESFRILDSRIRILGNNRHAGAAFSRNRGIQEAKGKYITFLDGDDIFEEEMLEIAYKAIEQYDADIVIYELGLFPNECIYEKKKKWRSEGFQKKFCTGSFSIRQFGAEEMMYWGSSPCNKLYRRNFIEKNQLRFQELPSANDVYFVNMALLLSDKLFMLNDRRIMIYARDHNEATRISYDRDPMCAYQAILKLGQELVRRGVFLQNFRYYYCLAFYILKYAITKTKSKEKARYFYSFLQQEGIGELSSMNRDCYNQLDAYMHEVLEKFKYLEFGSGWYNSETIFAYFLDRNQQKLLSALLQYKIGDKKTALWGAGINGGVFLRFLNKQGLKIAEVVDKDIKKQGTLLEGYVIKAPEECIRKVQMVIVCTFLIYEEVLKKLIGTGIRVINIEQILQEE